MSKKGFTLIELLVVAIIMGVLTAIAMPQYRRSMDRAKAAEVMQLLPAIFESRERWITEHGCTWTTTGYTCADGATGLSFGKLDIEAKYTSRDDGQLDTDTWSYYLVHNRPAGKKQPCVAASPNWGNNRGIDSATIYYRGDKFSCTEGTSGVCDLLNVADADHRSGCI